LFPHSSSSDTTPTVGTITGTEINLGKPFNVILFNDENHSMDEVVSQIMKAAGHGVQTATSIMMEAHNAGRAVVWSGHRERCEHIASVLEEIRLGTKVEPA